MAVKTKRTQLGNYITKINNYDIRQKVSYKKLGLGRESKHPQIETSEYVICRGRNIMKRGLKSIEEASKYANSH
jgi:hypothetical protein|tara:strand:- start:209 stop:430 length:222 start_codon:yes stop_codon:yes gene_type:complete